ncbi:hypothetical protein BU23DRAFT_638115 [Bimuria novae-zelandiae CBS 107.79]|uniref:Uncharacterized protein n=1 Tax=Bimuria novae-zelandiae CBS 107.79 TaxID=1447943 RepID=A0A6A5VAG0_9PLEO|nr:hypothetical protein BU23DRAFT_638115 [Bimuria novae-zelandiae CBS 107.79]
MSVAIGIVTGYGSMYAIRGFMYIGTIFPWEQFQQPDITGITVGRLFILGFLIMAFRRIPAIFMTYKLMPRCVKGWKEALFMGYFGPIGIGAVFYVEHTRHLFPKAGEALTDEENNLVAAMVPVVYWLVFFSIVFHGLSIPALDAFYRYKGVAPIVEEEPAEVRLRFDADAPPPNSYVNPKRSSVIVHNRFSRPVSGAMLPLQR